MFRRRKAELTAEAWDPRRRHGLRLTDRQLPTLRARARITSAHETPPRERPVTDASTGPSHPTSPHACLDGGFGAHASGGLSFALMATQAKGLR